MSSSRKIARLQEVKPKVTTSRRSSSKTHRVEGQRGRLTFNGSSLGFERVETDAEKRKKLYDFKFQPSATSENYKQTSLVEGQDSTLKERSKRRKLSKAVEADSSQSLVSAFFLQGTKSHLSTSLTGSVAASSDTRFVPASPSEANLASSQTADNAESKSRKAFPDTISLLSDDSEDGLPETISLLSDDSEDDLTLPEAGFSPGFAGTKDTPFIATAEGSGKVSLVSKDKLIPLAPNANQGGTSTQGSPTTTSRKDLLPFDIVGSGESSESDGTSTIPTSTPGNHSTNRNQENIRTSTATSTPTKPCLIEADGEALEVIYLDDDEFEGISTLEEDTPDIPNAISDDHLDDNTENVAYVEVAKEEPKDPDSEDISTSFAFCPSNLGSTHENPKMGFACEGAKAGFACENRSKLMSKLKFNASSDYVLTKNRFGNRKVYRDGTIEHVICKPVQPSHLPKDSYELLQFGSRFLQSLHNTDLPQTPPITREMLVSREVQLIKLFLTTATPLGTKVMSDLVEGGQLYLTEEIMAAISEPSIDERGIYIGIGFRRDGSIDWIYIGRTMSFVERFDQHKVNGMMSESSVDLHYQCAQSTNKTSGQGHVYYAPLAVLQSQSAEDMEIQSLFEMLWSLITASYQKNQEWLDLRAKKGLPAPKVVGANASPCFDRGRLHQDKKTDPNPSLLMIKSTIRSARSLLDNERRVLNSESAFITEETKRKAAVAIPMIKSTLEKSKMKLEASVIDLIRNGKYYISWKVETKDSLLAQEFMLAPLSTEAATQIWSRAAIQHATRTGECLTCSAQFIELPEPSLNSDALLGATPQELITSGGLGILLGDNKIPLQFHKPTHPFHCPSPVKYLTAIRGFLLNASYTKSQRLKQAERYEKVDVPAETSRIVGDLLKGTLQVRNSRSDNYEVKISQHKGGSFCLPYSAELADAYNKGQRVFFIAVDFESSHPLFLSSAQTYKDWKVSTRIGLKFFSYSEGQYKPFTRSILRGTCGLLLKCVFEARSLWMSTSTPPVSPTGLTLAESYFVNEPIVGPEEHDFFKIHTRSLLVSYYNDSPYPYSTIICGSKPHNSRVSVRLPPQIIGFWGSYNQLSKIKVKYRIDGAGKEQADVRVLVCRASPGPLQGKWFDIGAHQSSSKGRSKEFIIIPSLWKQVQRYNN